MLKTGFRGERKGILTPSLSQGEGECSDGKGGMWRRKGGGKMREVYKKESLLFCPREKAHISCF